MFVDLTGKRVGNRIVQWPVGTRRNHVMWLCVCDCGSLDFINATDLIRKRSPRCKSCARRTHGQARSLEYKMWGAAKHRAKNKNLEFNIDWSDIHIPEKCPLLEIPLIRKQGSGMSANSPSLDRINPTKGYVKGNVWVISGKANAVKNNASIEEVRTLLSNWEKLGL